MTPPATATPFHLLATGAHWLTLALLAAVYALIELRGVYPKGSAAHDAMKTWHFMLGLTVFGLVFGRLALRAFGTTPPISPPPPAWSQAAATAIHVALYAFLVAMPLLGWRALSAKGKAVPLFGPELPALLALDKAFAHRIETPHEAIGRIGDRLIGVHAAAALVHHDLLRGDTLRRMLPWPEPARLRELPRR